MSDIFYQWLLNNPIISSLIIVFMFVVVSGVVIAILEGRSITFWPPKIGARPAKAAVKTNSVRSLTKTKTLTKEEKEKVSKFIENPTKPMRSFQNNTAIKPYGMIELSSEPIAVLTCIRGESRGSWIFIAADAQEIHIGRHTQNGIDIEDGHISKNHLKLNVDLTQQSGNLFEITDLNSSNGTFINDQKLKPFHSKSIQDGDKVEIGLSTFEFRFFIKNNKKSG